MVLGGVMGVWLCVVYVWVICLVFGVPCVPPIGSGGKFSGSSRFEFSLSFSFSQYNTADTAGTQHELLNKPQKPKART